MIQPAMFLSILRILRAIVRATMWGHIDSNKILDEVDALEKLINTTYFSK